MHEVSHSITQDELDRLRDLRATTMLRLAADRIHRNYTAGTLDPTTREAVEAARDGLARLGNEIAARSRPRSSPRASAAWPMRSTPTTTSPASERSGSPRRRWS